MVFFSLWRVDLRKYILYYMSITRDKALPSQRPDRKGFCKSERKAGHEAYVRLLLREFRRKVLCTVSGTDLPFLHQKADGRERTVPEVYDADTAG